MSDYRDNQGLKIMLDANAEARKTNSPLPYPKIDSSGMPLMKCIKPWAAYVIVVAVMCLLILFIWGFRGAPEGGPSLEWMAGLSVVGLIAVYFNRLNC